MATAAAAADALVENVRIAGNIHIAAEGRLTVPQAMRFAGYSAEECTNKALQQRVRRYIKKTARISAVVGKDVPPAVISFGRDSPAELSSLGGSFRAVRKTENRMLEKKKAALMEASPAASPAAAAVTAPVLLQSTVAAASSVAAAAVCIRPTSTAAATPLPPSATTNTLDGKPPPTKIPPIIIIPDPTAVGKSVSAATTVSAANATAESAVFLLETTIGKDGVVALTSPRRRRLRDELGRDDNDEPPTYYGSLKGAFASFVQLQQIANNHCFCTTTNTNTTTTASSAKLDDDLTTRVNKCVFKKAKHHHDETNDRANNGRNSDLLAKLHLDTTTATTADTTIDPKSMLAALTTTATTSVERIRALQEQNKTCCESLTAMGLDGSQLRIEAVE
jgi:hypothetical protein